MVRSVALTFALLTAVSAAAQSPSNPGSQPPLPGNPNTAPPVAGTTTTNGLPDPNSAYAASAPGFAPVPDTAPAPVHSVRVSGAIMDGMVTNKVDPVYPAGARSEHLQGPVVLAIRIGRDGTVQDVQPISGPHALCEAAVDAVKQWTYQPYLLKGQPVEVRTTVTVTFQLNGPPHSS